MDSTLRAAGPRELGPLTALMHAFHAESGYALDRARGEAALAALLDDPRLGRVWVLASGDEAVGYVAVTFGFSLEHYGRDAFVDELYVRPAFRGRGLGARALERVEAECRALGVGTLHLEVERGNEAGQALYRRRGFAGNDRRLLSKRLSPEPA